MSVPVSICIPTYNGGEYIRDCLDSILAQTFTDFEVLIVDDQSSDNTKSILADYAQRDARIRVVQNETNLGLVGNWNRCIQLSRGEWLKFVFQDDIIFPDCLEKLFAATSLKIPIVFCRRNFIFEGEVSEDMKNGYLDLLFPEKFLSNKTTISAEEFCQSVLNNLWINFIGEPTSVLLHHSVFRQFGLFNSNLIQLCDLEYWIRVASNTGIVYVPECLASFRVHQKATSQINQTKNNFRRDLDPLVMMHMFAYDHHYEALRQAAINAKQPVNFKERFLRVAYAESNRMRFLPKEIPVCEANKITQIWNDMVILLPELNISRLQAMKQKIISKKIQLRMRLGLRRNAINDWYYSSYF